MEIKFNVTLTFTVLHLCVLSACVLSYNLMSLSVFFLFYHDLLYLSGSDGKAFSLGHHNACVICSHALYLWQ